MKITFIAPGYSPKPLGGFKVMYEYANQLAARGHDVTVVHPRSLPNFSPPPIISKLYHWLTEKARLTSTSVTIPGVPWHPIDNRVKLLSVPDLAPPHIPNGDAVFATFWATAEYVINYPPEKGRGFYLLQAYEIWAGPKERVDATWRAPLQKIVVSRGLYELRLKLGVPADQIAYIPNGIDHSRYRIIYPIDVRPPRIAMLYHPHRIKGAEDGIRALEFTRKVFPTLQAVLFGIVPRPETLPSWIEYHFNPPQEELISRIYNGSSIYLCPSWAEGFGLPPAEAMACGCAVVTTATEGVRDFAEHEVTALLSPTKDPKALAGNIIRLLRDHELRIQLAKAGNKRIQEFTWGKSTHLLEQLLLDKRGVDRDRAKS